jgi:transcriptional regulator with XRE-family HTH domain
MIKKKVSAINYALIGKNITFLMESCGIDATQLSQQTGLPASTISRLRSNATECSPNLSSLIPIANYFSITISQLIGEEPIDENHDKFKPSIIKKISVPILKAETITNYFIEKNSNSISFLNIDFPVSEHTFAYYLQGNAMEPHFPDKTILIIDPAPTVENLDHVLVMPNGNKTPIFRQVLIDGDEKYLRALNPLFKEFTKLTHDSHKIFGVMVQSRRSFKDDIEFSATTKINRERDVIAS